jgi:serine/threonine-protein kinase
MAEACRHCGQPHEPYVTVCPITGGRLGSATYTVVDEDELLVGSVVAERYHVRDILGQGSTGTVFGTQHMLFGRSAAMKVLRPRYTTKETLHRVFQQESRGALSVSHPSLCEVFDLGTMPDGAPFFVMEKLEGDTLGARLGRERFSTAAAVDLMMQLLAVMDAVHARDLLLRDLRPQNVFLAQRRGCRPVVKILDFGLARLIPLDKVEAAWDSLRAVVGANDASGLLSIPYYLSPERARGEQAVERASDIFVLAVLCYEALTAQKPFSASSWAGLMQQIVRAQPTPLGVLRPDVPQELQDLLARALSPNPRARPQTARDMQDELRTVFEGPRRGSSQVRAAAVSAAQISVAAVSVAAVSAAEVSAAEVSAAEVSAAASTARPSSQGERAEGPASFKTLIRQPGSRPLPSSQVRRAQEEAAPAQTTDRPAALASSGDDYEDETRTDQNIELSAAERLQAGMVDEASADHPIRTVRPPRAPPPPEVDIEVEVDIDVEHEEPRTSRGTELSAALGRAAGKARDAEEDEETATMQLAPEVRAHIERMTRAAVGPASAIEDSNRPPPTRRFPKPKPR